MRNVEFLTSHDSVNMYNTKIKENEATDRNKQIKERSTTRRLSIM